MNDLVLNQLRDLIQNDIGGRGLRTDPERNLVNACPDDFAAACHSIADQEYPGLAIVTGFFIPSATPPAGETDGPLGALFLTRVLIRLGIRVILVTDDFCVPALQAGFDECGLGKWIPIVALPSPAQAKQMNENEYWRYLDDRGNFAPVTHWLAIERVGPSHTRPEVPPGHHDRCHTMRGLDVTDLMSPAHRIFEWAARCNEVARFVGTSPVFTTIGIGDGGNEIGMGKIPWDVIERNIPNGGLVACRVPTDHLIACGVSNWGAYALAAGVAFLRGKALDASLFDPDREREILRVMVDKGGLVDGVLGKPSATVDGLTWEQYADVLTRVGALVKN